MMTIKKTAMLALAMLMWIPSALAQQEANAYTRHELLEPSTAKFHVFYETSVIQPGAKYYFNPVRKTSTASDVRVTDMASGADLEFKLIDDRQAAADGFAGANPEMNYIRVTLARPVPEQGGEVRIRLEKTYEDHTSYRTDGDTLTFERAVGAPRNAFVLPPGYELVSSSIAAQIAQEGDGRIRLSFFNPIPGENPLKIVARKNRDLARTVSEQPVAQRAHESQNIVYFLRDPNTHAFDVYRDHTEDRAGVSSYVNAVRHGNLAAKQYAHNLDTGEVLHPRLVKNAALFSFAPVKPGHSVRLRLFESYVDANSYRVDGDQLVFEQRLGEPTDAIVLPAGWLLTDSISPAMVSKTGDGRTRLDFINPRNDELLIRVRARRAG
jgi:hypothetical protein